MNNLNQMICWRLCCITATILLNTSSITAQVLQPLQPLPPIMFTEMNGTMTLDDGMELPIWGYGLSADGYITLPGPLLEYETGENVNLVFSNPSPESHTIHLHGLDVNQANDGVPTTSFLVVTGQNGAYNFTASQPGTFLYHCHVTTTLHLTMGMYGMILVRHPDGTLFEDGPTYHSDAPLLFSDLEIATNLAPVQSYPFHDIRPDYFMVNGLSGSQLDSGPSILSCPFGSQLALRLGSMAYTRTRLIFPPSLNATCWMSDGRPVPTPFSADTLDIFPGERFTVLISPPSSTFDGTFEVQYWDMLNSQHAHSNFIRFRDASLSTPPSLTPPTIIIAPNPARNSITIPAIQPWTIWDLSGRQLLSGHSSTIDISTLPTGNFVLRTSSGSSPFVKY